MANILLIDDEADVRRTVAAMLTRAQHSVNQAGNGREALAAYFETQPDLVITDINMPEMDGFEFITALRRQEVPVPILAVTGGGQMDKQVLLASAGLMGAVETLAKPFRVVELYEAVDRALEHGGAKG